MATLKETYRLYSRLDKDERKHVTGYILFIGKRSKKQFLELLKIFQKAKVYDENHLLNKTFLQKIKRPNEFANNLFNLILRAMMSYKIEHSVLSQMPAETIMNNFLINKGLADVAEKRSKRLIKKHENTRVYSSILSLQDMLTKAAEIQNASFEDLIDLINEKIRLTEMMLSDEKYIQLNYKLFSKMIVIGHPRNEAQRKVYEELSKDELITDINLAKSNFSKNAHYMLKSIIYFELGKHEEALSIIKDRITHCRTHFDSKQDPYSELYSIQQYINAKLSLNQPLGLEKEINRINYLSTHVTSKNVKRSMLYTILKMKLAAFIYEKKYMEGVKFVDNEGLKEFEVYKNINERLDNVILYAARLYFLNGNYKKALDQIDYLFKSESYKFDNSIIAAKCLQLLCHYKLGNDLMLPYSAKSLYRILLKSQQLFEPEKALVLFLQRLKHPDKYKGELLKLNARLTELAENPLNYSFFSNGDYFEWLKQELKTF